ncbi:hypothetical protein BATDEDRAFT_27560 [Batrachochytrium dendrobatidis JAM81]|uniref:Mpv17/PMP22 family protein n=2 Tax=Batrachochytrium dendrobatidis TaxID=109871 RepID=F4PB83_BATDJ|nr:uncharacterized protein BATDEDRAFT_27560 [Batrachochytrium dendrobatidis JAM81]EGF77278.1 hypothetical protein BATDEDRAFT_27560 [Batrachochytrium dendrobatidis JAM81]OAJ37924.1 hypothetical protein BDEG_21895 [Batrachochytrium dendrobatidis JEL423]|eukprot:XP_006681905.1 hypothetical protein BATDEDRAFT_27560 [Batrachochytrium dendrobatidis JAM81]
MTVTTVHQPQSGEIIASNPNSWTATLGAAYVSSIETRPVLTKAITASILNGFQEIIALLATGQRISDGLDKALKMAAYGLFVSGPTGNYLFLALEKLTGNSTRPAWQTTALKLLASNFVISPTLNTLYLTFIALISGASLADAGVFVKQRLLSIMKVSWTVFPLAQLFAFKYLQPSLWLPFFNFIAFLMGTFINIKAKLAQKKLAKTKGSDDHEKDE